MHSRWHACRGITVAVVFVALLSACGGGGGGGSAGGGNSGGGNPVSPPPAGPTTAQLQQAARLLDLATFGPTIEEIEAAALQGPDAWLDEQLNMSASHHMPLVNRYIDEYGLDVNGQPFPGSYRRFAFWERAMFAPDQLRQLAAYAFSQIFVISDNVDTLATDPRATASFYDTLLDHSLGNYRDLLRAVTLHPAMGVYLSHVNNGKTDPVANTFPDENYAREVMQLFSIGLYELNPDGSRRLDADGQPVATYDNDDIREFSKIFTGLSYGADPTGSSGFFGNPVPVLYVPMQMFEDYHEPGAKNLLNGMVVPAGQTGMQDIDDAVDNLFNHPNTGPFISRQLIQRLVTSNPSSEYVARVAGIFDGAGSGVRGDLAAVIRAVLTDPEATAGARLREPFRRYVALNRSLGARGADGTFPALGYVGQFLTQQHVLSAPSVFNFYLPDHAPAGELGELGLVGPEFQITNDSTVVGMTNLVAYALFSDQSLDTPENFTRIAPDLRPYERLADDPDALLERIDLVFFAGEMGASMRQMLADAINATGDDPAVRARLALYLALISPQYAVAGERS